MDIKTKYSIGDKVWGCQWSGCMQGKVRSIEIKLALRQQDVIYGITVNYVSNCLALKDDTDTIYCRGNEIFKTRLKAERYLNEKREEDETKTYKKNLIELKRIEREIKDYKNG